MPGPRPDRRIAIRGSSSALPTFSRWRDMLVDWLDALVFIPGPGDHRAVEHGRRQVQGGVALALASATVAAAVLIAEGGAWTRQETGSFAASLACFAIAGAGVLASSRLARAAMLAFAMSFVHLLGYVPGEYMRWLADVGGDGWHIAAMVAVSLGYFAGTALANAAPAARAYHRDQLAARRARRDSSRRSPSLADWRQGRGARPQQWRAVPTEAGDDSRR